MWIRVLSEWPGSPRCGTVADLPAPLAVSQIQSGRAEAVLPPSQAVTATEPETAMVQPSERAIKPRGRPRKVR